MVKRISPRVIGYYNKEGHEPIIESVVLVCLGISAVQYIVRVGHKVMLCCLGPVTSRLYMRCKTVSLAAIETSAAVNVYAIMSSSPEMLSNSAKRSTCQGQRVRVIPGTS